MLEIDTLSAMRPWLVLALCLSPLVAQDLIRTNLAVETQTSGPWHISKASVELPLGALSPRLISALQAVPPKIPSPDSFVSVRFQISQKGVPFEIRVDKSSDQELEDEVIAMIREWRFEAALRGDVPFVTQAQLDLSGAPVRRPAHPRPAPLLPQR